MEPKVVRAQCIEATIEDANYVECFMRRGKGAESVAIYLMPGEWLARYQECGHYTDCDLTIASYVAMALANGKVYTYEDEVAVYDLGCSHALYIFKIGGHVVLVDKEWDGWQDYVGKIGMRLEDLLEYVDDRYNGEIRRKVEEALRHVKLAQNGALKRF